VPAFSRVLLEEGGAGGQTDAGKSENSDIESEGDIEGEGEGHPLTHTVGYVQLTLPIPPPLTLLGSLLAPNSIPAGAAASQYGRAETGTSGSAVHSQEPDGTGLGDSETQQQKRQRTEPGPASCSWVVKEPVGSWEAWEVEAAEQRAALQAVHQLQVGLELPHVVVGCYARACSCRIAFMRETTPTGPGAGLVDILSLAEQ
jgi:hypothetical protein